MKNLIKTIDPSIFTKVTYDRVIYDALTDNVIVTGGEEEVEEVITYEYVDLGLSVKWATMNVGAKTEEDYGHYYMWGSIIPNTPDECNWANTPFNNGATSYDTTYFNSVKDTVIPNKVLAKEYDVAAQIMGGNWRMPTKDECQELYKNTTQSWVTINGVNGRKFTSKTDTSKYIFIPAAGSCYRRGMVHHRRTTPQRTAEGCEHRTLFRRQRGATHRQIRYPLIKTDRSLP